MEELRLRATELAIDADLAAGRHTEVIAELDGLIAEHPLRERLHAQCMLALYRSGRQAEALEAYRAARTALVDQIGVEPGGELRRLHEQILAQDPALDLPAESAPAVVAPPPVPAEPRAAPAASASRAGARPLLITAAVLVLAGVVAFGVVRVLEPDGLDAIDEDAVGLIQRDSGRITAQYTVGHGPQAVTSGAGSVWVANQLDGTVSRIDHNDGQVVTIDVGGEPTGVAFGAGSLWVADGQGRTVAQIAPQTNKVAAADRRRQRRARRRRRVRRGLGRVGGRRHRGADRRAQRQGRPSDRRAGTAVRARRRRRLDLGRQRDGCARRRGSTLARERRSRASTSVTRRARSRLVRARCGWRTAATGRSPGSTPGARWPRPCAWGGSRARSRSIAVVSGWAMRVPGRWSGSTAAADT